MPGARANHQEATRQLEQCAATAGEEAAAAAEMRTRWEDAKRAAAQSTHLLEACKQAHAAQLQ
eukprot:8031942-Pyramimonas_sp.AAC.1